MGDKEIRIKHSELQDPQTITQRNVRAFKEAELDIHRHEVRELVDDHDRGERVYKVTRPRTYVFLGKGQR